MTTMDFSKLGRFFQSLVSGIREVMYGVRELFPEHLTPFPQLGVLPLKLFDPVGGLDQDIRIDNIAAVIEALSGSVAQALNEVRHFRTSSFRAA